MLFNKPSFQAVALLLFAGACNAHPLHEGTGDVVHSLLHSFSNIGYLIVILAIGLWVMKRS